MNAQFDICGAGWFEIEIGRDGIPVKVGVSVIVVHLGVVIVHPILTEISQSNVIGCHVRAAGNVGRRIPVMTEWLEQKFHPVHVRIEQGVGAGNGFFNFLIRVFAHFTSRFQRLIG